MTKLVNNTEKKKKERSDRLHNTKENNKINKNSETSQQEIIVSNHGTK
jgi:hypothetical protein